MKRNSFMEPFSRRDFLKFGLFGMGALAFARFPMTKRALPDFPQGVQLGRAFATIDIKAKPNPDSTTVKTIYEDNVVQYHREVLGAAPTTYSTQRRWVETQDGYVPFYQIQPVKAILNTPLATLPVQSNNDTGVWAEITVPYVDASLEAPAKTPKIKDQITARFYYSQIFWVDQIKTGNDGTTLYRFYEKYGGYGDLFWADARAFRPITADDISPINPGVENKKVIVNLTHQTLSCYEDTREVMFTRVSTGARDVNGTFVPKWATPVNDYNAINRKFIAIHMAGGSTASGYEEFSVCWTSMFTAEGIALHSTYWHNNFGEKMSHGCVNLLPEDAKFIYRWSLPSAPYAEGRIEQSGYAGTNVQVKSDDPIDLTG